MSEKELIGSLRRGDDAAFRQVVDTFGERIYNTCLHFLRDTGESEDITQEVFIEVFRSIGKFKGDSSLSTWIYRIATNKCLEYQRYKKRKRRQAYFQSILGMDEASEYLEQQSVEYIHPGIQLEQKERSAEMFRAIDSLPEVQRLAFTLHHIDGMPYEEVGSIMEKSISSIESLLFRARQSLRKKLEKMYKHEFD